MGIGMTEWILIIIVVILLFGAKRIPDLARSLGRASYEFKKAKEELRRESEELTRAAEERAAAEDKADRKENDGQDA
ncbi:MAG: twin-arginine translocase TatA/TatE family subunit [Lentisphaerae bacterium]|nr:twin-arginine translocase TatA/TatE family subunit [Lentisphaerota bacterium]